MKNRRSSAATRRHSRAEASPAGSPAAGTDRPANMDRAARRHDRPLAVGLVLALCLGLVALGVGLTVGSARRTPSSVGLASSDAPAAELPASPEATGRSVRAVRNLSEVPPGPAEQVEVAYFHRTHRCWSCLRAEELTLQVLDSHYQAELGSGRMVFFSEDVQAPADADRVARYEAFGSSLYLGIHKAGAMYIYPVDEIWLNLGDETRFNAVLSGLLDAALGGAQ